jgi:hypothetical protein
VIKSRRVRWAEHAVHNGHMRNAYNISVVKHEGKKPLQRYRCRWEDNIKMYLGEIVCDDVTCNEPSGFMKDSEFLD